MADKDNTFTTNAAVKTPFTPLYALAGQSVKGGVVEGEVASNAPADEIAVSGEATKEAALGTVGQTHSGASVKTSKVKTAKKAVQGEKRADVGEVKIKLNKRKPPPGDGAAQVPIKVPDPTPPPHEVIKMPIPKPVETKTLGINYTQLENTAGCWQQSAQKCAEIADYARRLEINSSGYWVFEHAFAINDVLSRQYAVTCTSISGQYAQLGDLIRAYAQQFRLQDRVTLSTIVSTWDSG